MRKKITYKILSILLLFYNWGAAQTLTAKYLEVTKNGKVLISPFAGGLSAPQFSTIDLDGDGLKDLFIFDRTGNVVLTYLNKGKVGEIKYEYAPSYAALFPPLHTWCLLYDFNGDGIEDIFKAPTTLGIAGIEVWRGSRENGKLGFNKIKNNNFPADVLTFLYNGTNSNIYASIVDILGIADVDGDGDTDILTFEPDGAFLQLYVNKAIENGFGKDTMIMSYEESCFGKFIENQFSEAISLSNDGKNCASFLRGNDPRPGLRHSGSTVTPFDADCDGDMDILLGDISGEFITYLQNGGSPKSSWITSQDARWPSANESVKIRTFPAAFVHDINNDGKKDIIVASNESSNGQNRNNIWLYLDEGEACPPNFKLATKNFLVEEMLITSTGSHPTFFDYNGDGLLDVIIGTTGISEAGSTRQNRMFLLMNTGTQLTPSFDLADEDFLLLSALPNTLSRLAPCLGDMDGDGDEDLFVGNSQGGLLYFRNDGLKNGKTDFILVSTDYQNIFVGPNSSPVIYDFDKDGLLDFIIGESNNSLNFYKNKGSKNNPVFDDLSIDLPNTDDLGLIFPSNNFATQNGSPEVFTSKDQMYLLMGFNSDSLSLYRAETNNPFDPFTLLKKNLLPRNIGKRLNPSVADLNGDGFLDFLIGNERGGLSYFESDILIGEKLTGTKPIEKILTKSILFPNPVTANLFVKGIFSNAKYEIYNSVGNKTDSGILNVNNCEIDVKEFSTGIYFIRIISSSNFETLKFVKS